jgi:hypothetical protein
MTSGFWGKSGTPGFVLVICNVSTMAMISCLQWSYQMVFRSQIFCGGDTTPSTKLLLSVL